jgi:hypothetical protein
MSYSFGSTYGFSSGALPSLNEFNVCEANGIGVPLAKGLVNKNGVQIPAKLAPLVNAGLPAKLIRASGAIDWNGDGFIGACGLETNVELNFGEAPVAKDLGPSRSSTTFAPSVVEMSGRLWAIFVDKNGALSASQGPVNIASLLAPISKPGEHNALLFGVAKPIVGANAWGPIASEPTVISVEGTPRVYFRNQAAKLVELKLAFAPSASGVVSAVAFASGLVLYDPLWTGVPLCNPTVAYFAPTKKLMIVARHCATNALMRVTPSFFGAEAVSLGDVSLGKPGVAFDAAGNAFVFGSKKADATHTCSDSTVKRLFVRRFPANGGAARRRCYRASAVRCSDGESLMGGARQRRRPRQCSWGGP